MRFGIVLACEPNDGSRTVTQHWIDSDETIFAVYQRVDDRATQRFESYQLEGRMSPMSDDMSMIILSIDESDPEYQHWFWLQRVIEASKPVEQ